MRAHISYIRLRGRCVKACLLSLCFLLGSGGEISLPPPGRTEPWRQRSEEECDLGAQAHCWRC